MKKRLYKKNNIDVDKANELLKDSINNPQMPKELEGQRSIVDRMNDEFSSNESVRELFSGKNIRFKTQITEEQRSAITILYGAYKHITSVGIQFSGLKDLLDEFIDFGVPLDRKSRDEFVKASQQNIQNQAMMQQQMGMNQARNLRL